MEVVAKSSDVRLVKSNCGDEIRFGDVEKEKEIEERMRELGLWESKRELEKRVALLLDKHITETDGLTRCLKACRRARDRSCVGDVRNIIQPQVIRDCYGQNIAYRVNVLMGHFTRDVTLENEGRCIVISGSTPAEDRHPLSKEIRLELPPGVDTDRLDISYVAGVVKVSVPYVQPGAAREKERSKSEYELKVDLDDRERRKSVSAIYSLEKRLREQSAASGVQPQVSSNNLKVCDNKTQISSDSLSSQILEPHSQHCGTDSSCEPTTSAGYAGQRVNGIACELPETVSSNGPQVPSFLSSDGLDVSRSLSSNGPDVPGLLSSNGLDVPSSPSSDVILTEPGVNDVTQDPEISCTNDVFLRSVSAEKIKPVLEDLVENTPGNKYISNLHIGETLLRNIPQSSAADKTKLVDLPINGLHAGVPYKDSTVENGFPVCSVVDAMKETRQLFASMQEQDADSTVSRQYCLDSLPLLSSQNNKAMTSPLFVSSGKHDKVTSSSPHNVVVTSELSDATLDQHIMTSQLSNQTLEYTNMTPLLSISKLYSTGSPLSVHRANGESHESSVELKDEALQPLKQLRETRNPGEQILLPQLPITSVRYSNHNRQFDSKPSSLRDRISRFENANDRDFFYRFNDADEISNGHEHGDDAGHGLGHDDGHGFGHDAGHGLGHDAGHGLGHDAGHGLGHDAGHGLGYDAGHGLRHDVGQGLGHNTNPRNGTAINIPSWNTMYSSRHNFSIEDQLGSRIDPEGASPQQSPYEVESRFRPTSTSSSVSSSNPQSVPKILERSSSLSNNCNKPVNSLKVDDHWIKRRVSNSGEDESRNEIYSSPTKTSVYADDGKYFSELLDKQRGGSNVNRSVNQVAAVPLNAVPLNAVPLNAVPLDDVSLNRWGSLFTSPGNKDEKPIKYEEDNNNNSARDAIKCKTQLTPSITIGNDRQNSIITTNVSDQNDVINTNSSTRNDVVETKASRGTVSTFEACNPAGNLTGLPRSMRRSRVDLDSLLDLLDETCI